jgi:hypothetical protein
MLCIYYMEMELFSDYQSVDKGICLE